ncbi:MAG: glycosyltransferase family 2 protein [Bacteroidota bacterium]|jgi:teichuronic acid biosynthesis glycosyltransferase TuaG
MNSPIVSVIMPAYNSEEFIAEAINSVLIQTFPDWELIIIDDGSTDKTREIVSPFLKDKRVKYFYQENKKQGCARNNAVKHAVGDYLSFLDADDLYHPNKIEIQINYFKKQNPDLVFTQGWCIEGGTGKESVTERNVIQGLFTGLTFLGLLLNRNRIPLSSVMMKKECFFEVGGFTEDKEIQNAEDYQLWIKLADAGCNFLGINERTFYYRRHSSQSTTVDLNASKQVIWALEKMVFKSINEETKKKIMFDLISRFVAERVDKPIDIYFFDIIKLYKVPLGNNAWFYFSRFLINISPRFYKKFLYRKNPRIFETGSYLNI